MDIIASLCSAQPLRGGRQGATLGLGLALGLATCPVGAQGTAPFRQFDKVEITGSSIVRKEQTQALPVLVITRQDIAHSGRQDVAELLHALPIMSSFTSAVDAGMAGAGSNGAAIHGMQSGTLVLVNGRRLAPYGRQSMFGFNNSGAEVSALPLSAIERIELLTDGASTVYGTDALAGVVNIITRSERPGVEITAEHRWPDGGKGQSSRVDLSVGGGRLQREGYSWLVTADVQQQQELLGRDRPYAAQGRHLVQQDGQRYWAHDPQLGLPQSGVALASQDKPPWGRMWTASYRHGHCPQGDVPVHGQNACLYSPLWQTGLYPGVQAARLHGQWQMQLDEQHTAFVEVGLQNSTQSRASRTWPTYVARIQNHEGAPGHALAVANGFDPATGAWLVFSGAALGLAPRELGMQSQRLAAGVKGVWHDWDYRSSLYFSQNRARYGTLRLASYPNLGVDAQGQLTNAELLSQIEQLGTGSAGSQALTGQLQAMPFWNDTDEGTTRMTGLQVQASRPLWEAHGQDALLALGTDLRLEHDRYRTHQPALTQPDFSGKRTVWAQFAELQMPLAPRIEALASLRHDHYSDFGDTTHAKLAIKWQPDARWMVRGALGTGFRAPAIAQMQTTGHSFAGRWGFSACTIELQRVAQQLDARCPANDTYSLYSRGMPELRPEVSRNATLGLRFSPSRNQSLSVDYWQVDIRQRISQLTQETILGSPIEYAHHFERGTQGELQIYSTMANMGSATKSGLDLGWSLRRPTDAGVWQLRLNATWLLQSHYRLSNDSPELSDLNTRSRYDGYVVPRLRAQLHLSLAREGWHYQGVIHHVAPHDDGGFTGSHADTGASVHIDRHRVPGWWALDLAVRRHLNRQLQLSLALENVFNRRSPLSFGASSSWNFGANPMYASLWGRTLSLAASYRF